VVHYVEVAVLDARIVLDRRSPFELRVGVLAHNDVVFSTALRRLTAGESAVSAAGETQATRGKIHGA
jgi:hypothetical protein